MQYNSIQYSTVQYSTVQYSTVQYNTIQYNTIQYRIVQYSTIQYNTIASTNHMDDSSLLNTTDGVDQRGIHTTDSSIRNASRTELFVILFSCFECFFVLFLYTLMSKREFLPWEIQVAVHKESQPQQSRATQP